MTDPTTVVATICITAAVSFRAGVVAGKRQAWREQKLRQEWLRRAMEAERHNGGKQR